MTLINSPAARARTVRKRRRHPVAMTLSASVLALTVAVAVLAPVLVPHSPDSTDLMDALLPPGSADHLLGTDSTGRDVLSRVMYGARLSLLEPLAVVILSTALGTAMGLIAARRGGWVDAVLSRSMDIVFAFPSLLLAMLVVAAFGPGLLAPVCALAISYTPYIGRMVRSMALQEAARPYVDSYRVMGFSSTWVTVRHILPNITPVLLTQSALGFGYALVDLAALSFLGLGVQPPTSDWGAMISEAQGSILQGQPWSGLIPAGLVLLTVVCVNVLGEHLGAAIAGGKDR